MPLTPEQGVALKAHLEADPLYATDLANGNVNALAVLLNAPAQPAYWTWRPTVTRSDVYDLVSPQGTTWNWETYKGQTPSEQGAWTQMFMGDVGRIGLLNFRAGVFGIFKGSAPQNTQRAHIFAAGKRQASRVEKLFAVAVASVGGITIHPDNGNTPGDALGSVTNPAALVVAGLVSAADVSKALNPNA